MFTNARFTDFAAFLLHNPSFDWTISTSKLRVIALGTISDNVSLAKTVSFKAFNGLPGVIISNFQLPSDDPAGGIRIETDAKMRWTLDLLNSACKETPFFLPKALGATRFKMPSMHVRLRDCYSEFTSYSAWFRFDLNLIHLRHSVGSPSKVGGEAGCWNQRFLVNDGPFSPDNHLSPFDKKFTMSREIQVIFFDRFTP